MKTERLRLTSTGDSSSELVTQTTEWLSRQLQRLALFNGFSDVGDREAISEPMSDSLLFLQKKRQRIDLLRRIADLQASISSVQARVVEERMRRNQLKSILGRNSLSLQFKKSQLSVLVDKPSQFKVRDDLDPSGTGRIIKVVYMQSPITSELEAEWRQQAERERCTGTIEMRECIESLEEDKEIRTEEVCLLLKSDQLKKSIEIKRMNDMRVARESVIERGLGLRYRLKQLKRLWGASEHRLRVLIAEVLSNVHETADKGRIHSEFFSSSEAKKEKNVQTAFRTEESKLFEESEFVNLEIQKLKQSIDEKKAGFEKTIGRLLERVRDQERSRKDDLRISRCRESIREIRNKVKNLEDSSSKAKARAREEKLMIREMTRS